MLKEIYKDPPSKREIILYTGPEGMNSFNIEIKREFIKILLKQNLNKFTTQEVVSLTKMINSSDMESLELVIVLIEQKNKK